MDRRKFLQTSSVAAAGMMMLPTMVEAGRKKKSIGLQLYTLRDVIMQDVKGTLSSVAAMGYNEVETFGYNNGNLFGMPVAEFRKYMDGRSSVAITELTRRPPTGRNAVKMRNSWARALS